jgi:DNA-binding NarL/FixJ family response regulator
VDSIVIPEGFLIQTELNITGIYSDLTQIIQIFTNWLSNALKHNDKKEGRVRITARECEKNKDWVEILVADSGLGIPMYYHEKVFQVFQTLEPRDKTENTGVGLAVVKKIVESSDCAGGFSEMAKQEFDCIQLDYQLPDGDGIEFLQKLMLSDFKSPPILFLTGQGDELLAVEALRSGAADYIPKDILSANRLSRSIENAVRFHQLEVRAKDAEAKLAASEEKYRIIVERISDLVFQLDSKQNITFANTAFEMLGYDALELIGKPIKNLIASDDLDVLLSKIATRDVGPLATTNLEVRFKTNPESSLNEEFPVMTVRVDASGMWDVSDEMVFKDEVAKKFLGTLCVGRYTSE